MQLFDIGGVVIIQLALCKTQVFHEVMISIGGRPVIYTFYTLCHML
jgi:hypothetical protein